MGRETDFVLDVPNKSKGTNWGRLLASALLLSTSAAYLLLSNTSLYTAPTSGLVNNAYAYSNDEYCPQAPTLHPSSSATTYTLIGSLLSTEAFKKSAAELLGGAVRIPTQTYDDMGALDADPRWEVQKDMHAYLHKSFPNVEKHLQVETINTYGLLYTWKGADEGLKPLLMMGHSDVVPVDPSTVEQWDHPPFSGYFDGERVWGRGSSDDKSGLIGTLIAVETLLSQGFEPTRTVILAFGFDEEIGGRYGASFLAKTITERYGEDSLAIVIDEGGGFTEKYGAVFASPGVTEKGAMNVRIDVSSPGGHSSVPPSHTSIGMLAAVLVEYENNPIPVHFDRASPLYAAFQCFALHGPSLPASLRTDLLSSTTSDTALLRAESTLFEDRTIRSLVGTTQAADIIGGGVKVNALPENAYAVVNRRIAVQSSLKEIQAHDTALLEPLAQRFNLTYTAFDQHVSSPGASSSGTLTLSAPIGADPAPVTPIHGAGYALLGGTIRAAYNAHRGLDSSSSSNASSSSSSSDERKGKAKDIIVSPGMPSGNTDTHYYWALSENIFRYTHHNLGDVDNALAGGVHTVNERMEIDAFVETIRFYVTLILNVDESREV